MTDSCSNCPEEKYVGIVSNRKKIMLELRTILYVRTMGRFAEVHTFDGKIYKTRTTLEELEKRLGGEFIEVRRGCLVSIMAIQSVTDMINLSNGESLKYVIRKKKEILAQLQTRQKEMLGGCNLPVADVEYHAHYRCFDEIPVAFADIERVFDEERGAVDWIVRYGNPALAKLEKLPLELLIGSVFSNLLPSLDGKWLRAYDRVALDGETLEIFDYSPDIGTYLRVLCFPTFRGHCGCILSDVSQINSIQTSRDAPEALMYYFSKLLAQTR